MKLFRPNRRSPTLFTTRVSVVVEQFPRSTRLQVRTSRELWFGETTRNLASWLKLKRNPPVVALILRKKKGSLVPGAEQIIWTHLVNSGSLRPFRGSSNSEPTKLSEGSLRPSSFPGRPSGVSWLLGNRPEEPPLRLSFMAPSPGSRVPFPAETTSPGVS